MATKYWIGIASKDHIMTGVAGNFCQLGHGKHAPVKRLNPADWLIYYAPRTKLKGGDKVQAFVALGQIQEGDPYLVGMSMDFSAWRRNISYQDVRSANIHDLLDQLNFITDRKHWGILFRRPMFEVSESDFNLIARAMEFHNN